MVLQRPNKEKQSESFASGEANVSIAGRVTAPRPPLDDVRATTATVRAGFLRVDLADGREIRVPLRWFPRLMEASEAERKQVELLGEGTVLHWDAVDEDISVASLIKP
jgi:hypothetical protein